MVYLFKSMVTVMAVTTATGAYAGAAEDIEKLSRTFEAAFNSGDAAGVAALYTTDAVLLPPDAARIDGREAVQGLWQSFIDAGVTDLKLTTVNVDDLGNTANELGTFTLAAPDGNGGTVQVNGKYIVVWKADDNGVLQLDWDIWNSTP